MSASEARVGVNRPTEGTRPNRRLSTTRPQASSVMTPPTWLWMIAKAGADRAPQDHPGEPAEREQQNVAAAEHDGEATPVEDRVSDRPADCLAEDPECDSGQCAGDDLGGQDV